MTNTSNWFDEYKLNRYLRNTPDVYLEQRRSYLAANLWSTDKDGAVTAPRNAEHRQGILRLYTHTLFEQGWRTPADIDFDEASVRADASSSYVPPKLNQKISFGADCFAKFGKEEHLTATLERGTIRIAPAGAYADTSLNAAQKDDELEHAVQTPNEHLVMKLNVRDADGREREVVPEFRELFRYMMVPNFYVWCCGHGYDARLFHEFEANAALIIHNKSEFISRLERAVQAIHPADQFYHGPIGYYDPYTTERGQLTWGYSKHVRYLYQNEYRFTWQTSDPDLSPFFVELGPLQDIASILKLE